jgi:hypothetical protein
VDKSAYFKELYGKVSGKKNKNLLVIIKKKGNQVFGFFLDQWLTAYNTA